DRGRATKSLGGRTIGGSVVLLLRGYTPSFGEYRREEDMPHRGCWCLMRVIVIVSSMLLVRWLGAAQAQDKTYVMKVTTPTINDAPHLLAKNFAAAVERDSGGRIKGEVYPASQLGSIPR